MLEVKPVVWVDVEVVLAVEKVVTGLMVVVANEEACSRDSALARSG